MLRAAFLVLALSVSAPAFADPGGTPDTPHGGGPGGGSGLGAAPADQPTIATPAPNADPQKVEDAKKIADSAKLTPIIPSPNNATKPAFQLYAEIDAPILAVGAVFAVSRLIKQQPAYCAPACTDTSINSIDKLTAGYYSASWSTASDYELYGLGVASAALLLSDEDPLSALNDAVVIGEATISATAVSTIMTLAAGRPRPFLYSDKAPLSVRNSADAGLSFLSSHTSEAFALVTSMYIAEKRLHPGALKPKVYLGVGLAVSTMIGVSRVLSGYHFITDVVGGAVVGSSLGVLIASVHGSPVHIVPVTDPATKTTGVGITGTF